MAFDLVQYFVEQINIQKPRLLSQFSPVERQTYIIDFNALTLGKLINLWKTNEEIVYQEINTQDELYIREIARHLTTSPTNQSNLEHVLLENTLIEILSLQFKELKQLNDTANLDTNGLRELILGQVEHLSGQANDWVWLTNNLTELIGSKPTHQDEISLDTTLKEFNQMVQQHLQDDTTVKNEELQVIPTWSKIVEPLVALAILWLLYTAVCQVFA